MSHPSFVNKSIPEIMMMIIVLSHDEELTHEEAGPKNSLGQAGGGTVFTKIIPSNQYQSINTVNT